jgi:hypothetical protein
MVGDRLGQPRDLAEQPVAARLHRRVEVEVGGEVQDAGDGTQVEQFVVGNLRKTRRDLRKHPVGRLDEVVLAHEAPVFVDATGELFELQTDEPTVGAELNHVLLDFLRDAAHHLRALQDGCHVARGDEIFDFQRRQRAAHTVEARLVTTEDL